MLIVDGRLDVWSRIEVDAEELAVSWDAMIELFIEVVEPEVEDMCCTCWMGCWSIAIELAWVLLFAELFVAVDEVAWEFVVECKLFKLIKLWV